MVVSDSKIPDQPILYVSEGFERLSGYTREDLLGRNCNIMKVGRNPPLDSRR